MRAEELREPTPTTMVRLRAPPGIAAIQIFDQHYNIGPDGTFVMPAEDADFVPEGWTKIAEWTCEDAA